MGCFISDCITSQTSQHLGFAVKPVLHYSTHIIVKKLLSRTPSTALGFWKCSMFIGSQYPSNYLFKQLETIGISACSHIFSHRATPYGKISCKIWL